jgi:dihydroorotate dehydrogenase electron transfer subunit
VHAEIVFNRPISAAYRHLGVAAPGFPGRFGPGQFVMVRSPGDVDPFLPRAFSIYRLVPSTGAAAPVVEILYKVLGKGTRCLSRMEPGQAIEILGPLGNSFIVPEGLGGTALVAGGIGVPPIAALATALAQSRVPRAESREGEVISGQRAVRLEVFLGGKTHEDILCVKDFEEAGATVHIATEDGSLGAHGLITEILEPFLRTSDLGPRTIFTCGPPGMLAAVARLAEARGVLCQTSVEANMACGFGACMGCAVEVRSDGSGPRYKLVCKDGPVFDSRVIKWE